jgi:hypothetical protein
LVSGTPLPGRKSIAHGVENFVTSATVNGLVPSALGWAELFDWQAATSTAATVACKMLRLIQSLL